MRKRLIKCLPRDGLRSLTDCKQLEGTSPDDGPIETRVKSDKEQFSEISFRCSTKN